MDGLKKFIDEWKTKPFKEKLYMTAGAFALALAIIGVVLPIVPQVPFAILAAFFFSKGSPRIHQWIRKNKYMGRSVRDWEDHRVIRPNLKILSSLMLAGGAAFGHWKLSLTWAILLDVVFLASIVFVLTRKSKPKK
jgi:uncharacterized protein